MLFGLTKDGTTIAETREFEKRPPDLPGKGWKWLALTVSQVAHDQEQTDVLNVPAGTAVRNVPGAPPVTVLTYAAFRARFTDSEMASVRAAVLADAEALDWALDAAADNSIDLTSNRTSAFLNKIVTAGIVDSERKTEILTP